MLQLQIKADVLEEGSKILFLGAALELTRYEGQELQVNTYLYFEKEGEKAQFITYNHCDAEKNLSLEKQIICENVNKYTFPRETAANQVIYYVPGRQTAVTIAELTRQQTQECFGGELQGERILGCNYFAFLRQEDENDYMVLLSVKKLQVIMRPAFLSRFGIDFYEGRHADCFEQVFVPGKEVRPLGMYLGIVKISDIYATESRTYFLQDGQKYQYTCLEKFEECKDGPVRNTRFFRECSLQQVEQFQLPQEDQYAMTEYYLPVTEGNCQLRTMEKFAYKQYVPFEEKEVTVVGCPYFAVTMQNRAEKDSEKVLYSLIEEYKKTRFRKFSGLLADEQRGTDHYE